MLNFVMNSLKLPIHLSVVQILALTEICDSSVFRSCIVLLFNFLCYLRTLQSSSQLSKSATSEQEATVLSKEPTMFICLSQFRVLIGQLLALKIMLSCTGILFIKSARFAVVVGKMVKPRRSRGSLGFLTSLHSSM